MFSSDTIVLMIWMYKTQQEKLSKQQYTTGKYSPELRNITKSREKLESNGKTLKRNPKISAKQTYLKEERERQQYKFSCYEA